MARRSASFCFSSLLSAFFLTLLFSLSGCGGSSKPISVTITKPASTSIDPGGSVTLTASVANDSTNAGVTWTMTGTGCTGSACGALSNSTSTSATYTAPGTVTTAFTVTITATSKTTTTQTATITLNIPANPAITTALGALTAGQVGSAYSVTVAISGGVSPYTWTVTQGNLPAGLTLGASTGTISGIPTGSGSSTFTLKVTDSGSPALTASGQFSIAIAAAPAIVFSTSSLANATYNVAYSANVVATGGAGTLTYKVTTGSLPTGLTMASTGAISGTPTAGGTFNFTVTASDAYGDSNSQAYSIQVVYPQLVVAAVTLPTGYAGSLYTPTTLTATGGNGGPYTWSWAAASGSSLPAGLSLASAGVISGTPTTAGSYSVVVTAKDSASNTGNLTLPLTVKAGVSITTSSLPSGYTGSPYPSTTLAATGGAGAPYTWSWAAASGSSLPAGLSLSSAGTITGTPTTAGTYSVVVTAKDSASNSANAALSITILVGVSVTTMSLPSGYQGTAYTATTLAATGGTGTPYTWTWAAASGSSLPTGLTLGSSTGTITGTPTTAGTYSVVVTAKDSAGNTGSATLSITIEAAIAITTPSLPTGAKGETYSATLVASGGTGTYTWTWAAAAGSSLPPGLTLGSSTGMITGTPTTAGTYSVVITVTDSASHTANVTLSLTINASLAITTTSLPYANTGTLYSEQLAATGGTGSDTWSTTGTSNLSTFNLTLSSSGLLSGTPTTTGTVSFTAQVKDSSGDTATQPYTFAVYSALSQNSTGLPLTGTTSVNYSGTVTGTGGSGNYCWTVTGLSDGLTAPVANSGCGYASSSVSISGTPATAETVTITVKLTDTTTSASVSDNYNIVISNPAPLTLPSPNPTSLGSATVNQSYTGSINASGGVSPYTWTIGGTTVTGSGVALSDGLTAYNTGGNTLSVSGTPTSTGTVTLTSVKVTSGTSTAGPDTYTIAVNSTAEVSGQISLSNNCGNGSVPTITVSINTNPVQTTTTDSSGNYSFASVPNGIYTVTPSITGPSSVFYPATQTGIDVENAPVTGVNFNVSLGYTVSGNISYSGSNTGQVYVTMLNNNCSGDEEGTSITDTTLTSVGAYTIRGVPPGTYSVYAWMDTLGQGYQNTNDPSGTGGASVTVTDANVTGAADTLLNPTIATPTASPTIQNISPTNDGVAIAFKPITNSNGVEEATSYDVQWSTSSSFSSPTLHNFAAVGTNGNVWILNDGTAGVTGNPFTNGDGYYFEARARTSAGAGPWTVFGGTTPTAVTVGAPTAGNTVTGTITIPSTVTIASGAVLYAGFYNQSTDAVYAERIASPAASNAFSVQVPNGTNYFLFGILDQNNDGLIDAGDVTNTNQNNTSAVTISGPASGEDATLPGVNSAAAVSVQLYEQTNQSGYTSTGYNLDFAVLEENKLPVAVTLMSGPDVIDPVDLSGNCQGCGTPQFQYLASIAPDTPAVGSTYGFQVTYSDGTSATVNSTVTAVPQASEEATNLQPTGTGASTTPTFTWTYPGGASSYTYLFYLYDSNGNLIWAIPSQNSNSNGFTSAQIPGASIAWGVDPTNSSNRPSVSSLTPGETYYLYMFVLDSNNNEVQSQVSFTTTPAALSLPSPNPSSLGPATVGDSYSGAINASGGTVPGNFTFTIDGTTVGSSGLALSDGLTATNYYNGGYGSTLDISGTPNTAGTVTLTNVEVTDSSGNTAGPYTYTIQVNSVALQSCSHDGSANSILKGSYAFLMSGFDPNGNPYDEIGDFQASGSGDITSGNADVNASAFSTTEQNFTFTGSYSIGDSADDDRGTTSWNNSNTSATGLPSTTTYCFAADTVTSGVAESGRIVEADGSGYMLTGFFEIQDSANFTAASLDTGYAFGVQGWGGEQENGAWNREALIGQLALNGSGTVTSGQADNAEYSFSTGSTTYKAQATLTGGSYTMTSSGRGTMTLDTSSGSVEFIVYTLGLTSGNNLLMLGAGTGNNGGMFVGRAVQQSQTTFTSLGASSVFREIKTTNPASVPVYDGVTVGQLTWTSTSSTAGTLSGIADENAGGTISLANTGSYAYTLTPSGYLTLSGSNPSHYYLYAPGSGFGMDATVGIDFDVMQAQTVPSGGFSASTVIGNSFAAGTIYPAAYNTSLSSSNGNYPQIEADALTFNSAGTLSGTSDGVEAPGTAGYLNLDNSFGTSNTWAIDTTSTPAGSSTGRYVIYQSGTPNTVVYLVSPTQAFVIQVSSGEDSLAIEADHQ